MSSNTSITKQTLWQERLRDWQASGLSGAQWCRQQALPEHQLSYWKRKLQTQAENKLVPIVVTPKEKPVLSQSITLRLPSGLCIETETTDVVALIQQLQQQEAP